MYKNVLICKTFKREAYLVSVICIGLIRLFHVSKFSKNLSVSRLRNSATDLDCIFLHPQNPTKTYVLAESKRLICHHNFAASEAFFYLQ